MKQKIAFPVKEKKKEMVTASHKFVTALAFVSIIGFGGIVSSTLFNFNMNLYVESFFMIIIGFGFMIEGKITKLWRIRDEGLTTRNFTHLTTSIIGLLAIITGIFSIPQIRIETGGFLAVKGIIALIAIVIIVIQTWIVE